MTIDPTLTPDPLNRPATPVQFKPLTDADFGKHLADARDDAKRGLDASPLRPLTALAMTPGVKGPIQPLRSGEPPAPPLLPFDPSAYHPGGKRPPQTEQEKVQEQARKWVAQTFYGTMLKQMRDSPFKSDLFSGGRGGQAFTPMLDQHLADRMSRSADPGLVRSIARKLQARSAYGQPPAMPKTTVNPRAYVAPSLRA